MLHFDQNTCLLQSAALINMHGCYSSVKIAFAPICACTNNRWTCSHNANNLRSSDVTDQLWWRHNAKPERPSLATMVNSLGDFGNDFHSWLHHSRKSLPNLLIRDKISVFTVTRTLYYIPRSHLKYTRVTNCPNIWHLHVYQYVLGCAITVVWHQWQK